MAQSYVFLQHVDGRLEGAMKQVLWQDRAAQKKSGALWGTSMSKFHKAQIANSKRVTHAVYC